MLQEGYFDTYARIQENHGFSERDNIYHIAGCIFI